MKSRTVCSKADILARMALLLNYPRDFLGNEIEAIIESWLLKNTLRASLDDTREQSETFNEVCFSDIFFPGKFSSLSREADIIRPMFIINRLK